MTKFYFNIFVLLVFFTAVSTALTTRNDLSIHKLEKRTTCPYNSKRSVLIERNEDKQCSCSMAEAIFSNKLQGLFFFAQDECGSTTIAGLFSSGFEVFNSTSNITFEIIDSCNRTLYDLTDGLNVQFNYNGSTKPFRYTFDEINLDCDKDGILFPQVGKSHYNKRTCDSLRRRDGENQVACKESGDIFEATIISDVET
ncbi:10770_t:CDS:1 [Funneliformis geosporum]|uniref:16037_t:CDS:1 n=1 Tax=Funneliformis geosporum TaxID=1117311 RepID=A0A9W4SJW4_9GLOM|nr:16037_t:CDS:1 [Funneliformis geosporum]CAI2175278.1 10770_t:CDS:1 [Funneliformis geosporum]